MIFLINHSTISHPGIIDLNKEKDLDLFIWNNTPDQNAKPLIPETYQTLTNDNILLSLKASLKESKNVLITNGVILPPFYDHDLKKQRVFIQNSDYIFFSPRASFFFKAPLVNISLNSFTELEALVKKWGK